MQDYTGRKYLCERCGGTGQQSGGQWDGTAYAAPAGICDDCHGIGWLGTINVTLIPYNNPMQPQEADVAVKAELKQRIEKILECEIEQDNQILWIPRIAPFDCDVRTAVAMIGAMELQVARDMGLELDAWCD
jgi:hypothetical protein